MEIERPLTVNAMSPFFTLSPSFIFISINKDGSILSKIHSANSIPAIIPWSFTINCALPILLFGMQDNEL